MARPYSVFVGDVALDEFFRAPAWPTAGTKMDITPVGTYVGGMIANAAAVYASLGESVRFVWSMNGSDLTTRLLADLEQHGIDTSLVVRDDALADSRNIIVLADGDHTVLTPALGLVTIDLTDAAVDALRGAQNVYTAIGDLRSLRHGGRGAGEVIADVRAAGARLVLDLDVAPLLPGDEALVALADLLLVNRVGFERLRAGRSPEATVAALLDGAASVVVVTLGAEGCRVHTRAGGFAVPGLPVEPVDVTGAGDTFGAALVHALNVTDDLRAAAGFANAAASRAVTLLGARSGVAAHADVLAFMRAHGLPTDLPTSPTPDADPAPGSPAAPPTTERHAT